jgi:hypothetical protein
MAITVLGLVPLRREAMAMIYLWNLGKYLLVQQALARELLLAVRT